MKQAKLGPTGVFLIVMFLVLAVAVVMQANGHKTGTAMLWMTTGLMQLFILILVWYTFRLVLRMGLRIRALETKDQGKEQETTDDQAERNA
jgi:hypothetical protein